MKTAVFCILISFLVLAVSDNNEIVRPGKELQNQDKERNVYLLLTLKPGETFKNNSDKHFRVLKSAKELRELSEQLQIESQMQTISDSLSVKLQKLRELERLFESAKDKRATQE